MSLTFKSHYESRFFTRCGNPLYEKINITSVIILGLSKWLSGVYCENEINTNKA